MQLVKDKQDAVTALYISTRVVVKQAHFPHTFVYYDRHAVQFTYGLSGIASQVVIVPRICVYSQSFLCVCILSVFKSYTYNSGMDNNRNGSA